MTDYPPGEWSPILIGHVWPNGSNLTILSNAEHNFADAADRYRGFLEQLSNARSGPLANQQGRTADDLRETFSRGEKYAREVSEKNGIKRSACHIAHDSVRELRSQLTSIAEEGNGYIRKVLDSNEPAPTKIDHITEIVFNHQSQANDKAATCSQNILAVIQTVLNREDIATSSLQFAAENGMDNNRMLGSPNKEGIREKVKATVQPYSSAVPGTTDSLSPSERQSAREASPTRTPGNSYGSNPLVGSPSTQQPLTSAPGRASNLRPPLSAPKATPPGGVPLRMPAAGLAQIPTPHLPSAGASPAVSPVGLSPGLTPSGLAESFDRGMQTSAPMSSAASALAGSPTNTVEPQTQPNPPHIAETPVAPTLPSNAHVPVVDAPQPTHAPAAAHIPPPSAPQSDMTTTYFAGPMAPAAPAAPAPTALPSYGADIRPPTPTATVMPTSPAGSTPIASAAIPTSSPAGASGLSQPAVVRQPGTAAPAPHTPAGVTEQAVAAAGSGAATSVASAAATARARLQRLADAVARQERRLRWAAGERADGTTVLVTDLAGGWIPPGINIPVGLQLLEPAHRRGELESLLGNVDFAASYTPAHYLPPEEDVEPVATSTRARQAPAVEELGWELVQATKWRDDLPRLAHTLAKAASTGTGVLDSEIDLLQEHLAEVRKQVLDSYPQNVSANLVGNWQLLGAIDALIEDDKATANYHFAWFQALSQAATRGRTQ